MLIREENKVELDLWVFVPDLFLIGGFWEIGATFVPPKMVTFAH